MDFESMVDNENRKRKAVSHIDEPVTKIRRIDVAGTQEFLGWIHDPKQGSNMKRHQHPINDLAQRFCSLSLSAGDSPMDWSDTMILMDSTKMVGVELREVVSDKIKTQLVEIQKLAHKFNTLYRDEEHVPMEWSDTTCEMEEGETIEWFRVTFQFPWSTKWYAVSTEVISGTQAHPVEY